MKNSRREFILKSGIALGSVALLNHSGFGRDLIPTKTVESIGFQVWPIKDQLFKDFSGTMKMMSKLGYQHAEMCSPLGYSNNGFAPLNKLPAKELRRQIEDAGLVCRSSHYTFDELKNNLDDRIQWAIDMGNTQMILSCFWWGIDASADEYRKAADDLNVVAEKIKAAGLQTGFHNHHMEFEMSGDELIYDAILDQLDPDLVKMQFQVAVVNIGYKAADYFRKYPGRFVSAHLADWSKETGEQVALGQGEVDWKDFFEAAKIGGVENIYVEMSPDKNAESAIFLASL
ncbi:MAG: sugar phosphate isomerase/epimerase [Reichenbachiella sp.]